MFTSVLKAIRFADDGNYFSQGGVQKHKRPTCTAEDTAMKRPQKSEERKPHSVKSSGKDMPA
jgi:hypothetical protein